MGRDYFCVAGGIDAVAKQVRADDEMARPCVNGVRAILVETADGTSRCADCAESIPNANHLGASAVVQRDDPPATVTAPAPTSCAPRVQHALFTATGGAVQRLYRYDDLLSTQRHPP